MGGGLEEASASALTTPALSLPFLTDSATYASHLHCATSPPSCVSPVRHKDRRRCRPAGHAGAPTNTRQPTANPTATARHTCAARGRLGLEPELLKRSHLQRFRLVRRALVPRGRSQLQQHDT